MENRITALILESLREFGDDMGIDGLRDANADTRLYGRMSLLDSIGLVNLIADLEERIEEAFGVNVVLADERAMSMTRSPFRRVGTLAGYIGTLVEEMGAG